MKLKNETLFFVGIFVVVLLGLVGLLLLASKPLEVVDTKSFVRDNNYFFGSADAKVILVEFGDFQCPACKATEPALQQIRSEYKDKIKFVFKHFPLPSHNNALVTAKAAEAAGVQGKFWEMHDKIYDAQDEWSSNSNPSKLLEGYAKEIGLDLEQFKKDLNSNRFDAIINKDKSDGINVGVDRTPTFFLNGKKFIGVLTFEEFKEKIEKKLTD